MMMDDDANEVTVFDNAHLRNTWQARVNQYKEKETCENERRQKSALPQLFDQWHQRWACRSGISLEPEKKSKGHEMSEFRRTLELRSEELEKSKTLVIQPRPRPPPIEKTPLIPPLPKIPPPKKRDPEARKPSNTPKPQLQIEPTPKREEVRLRKVPKPEPKKKETVKTMTEKVVLSSIADKANHTPTPQPRKKEVKNVQQKPSLRDWNNSWKYARSRPNQKIKSVNTKKDRQFMSNRKKSIKLKESINIETPSLSEWIESWKFLNGYFNQPTGQELMQEKLNSFLFCKLEQEKLSRTEWAESWKVLNLQLCQENESWDKSWSQYCRDFQSNKLQNCQLYNEQASLFGWEESWKFLKHEQEKENNSDGRFNVSKYQAMEIKKLLLNWTDSWKLPNAQHYDDTFSLAEWNESWRSSAVQDKCTDSLDSHHSGVICMQKNIKSNGLFNSKSTEDNPFLSEWSESWMFPKSLENEKKIVFYEDIADPHLPPQSQKKTFFSKWKESWKFSNATDEKISQSAWSNAWKLSFSMPREKEMDLSENDTNTSSQLVLLQPYNNKFSMSEWNEYSEKLSVLEWNESWKTIKPQIQQDSDPESMAKEPSHLQLNSENMHLSDWNMSWKLSVSQVYPHAPSPTEWSDSQKRLNPEPRKEQEFQSDKCTFKNSFNGLFHMEKPCISEWSDSWKSLKFGSPGSQANSENMAESEWGASWKCVNPQCNLDGVPWSQQDECKGSENDQTKNKLSILSRGDRSSKCFDDELQLCLTEWNESWKLLKTLSEEQQEAKSK